VAVIGFSLGGWAGLTYAARMPDTISAVVTYYPSTDFITNPGDFASKVKVPTLIFAGVLDTYKDCCVIERARKLAAAGAGGSISPVEYPDAGHAFAIVEMMRQTAVSQDSRLSKAKFRLNRSYMMGV
jgi:dienelactone hydrolase